MPDVIDQQRCRSLRHTRNARKGHGTPGTRWHENAGERLGTVCQSRVDLHDDAILTCLREQRRNLSLAERTVERVVNLRHRHAEPACRITIDLEVSLQAAILKITRNVRQLRHVIENMVVMATGNELRLDDLPGDIRPKATDPGPGGMQGLVGISITDAEKELIRNTLKLVNGNREQAAKILGIGERTLYRKIKEYDLT